MEEFNPIEGVDRVTIQTYIDTRQAYHDRPYNVKDISELVAILCPEAKISLVKKIVSLVFYMVVHLVYIEKQPVKLPYLGLFNATWKPAYNYKKTLKDGTEVDKIVRSKWEFNFHSNLMKAGLYKKYHDKHSRDAKKILGVDHMLLDADVKKIFEREFDTKLNWDYPEDKEAFYEFRDNLMRENYNKQEESKHEED